MTSLPRAGRSAPFIPTDPDILSNPRLSTTLGRSRKAVRPITLTRSMRLEDLARVRVPGKWILILREGPGLSRIR